MGVNSFLNLPFFGKEQGIIPQKFFLIVLWKTQNQQNKKIKNGYLVAPKRNWALTIFSGGDASIKPKHLSFLTGGTGNITKGNRKNSDQRVEMSQTRQPSAKTVN